MTCRRICLTSHDINEALKRSMSADHKNECAHGFVLIDGFEIDRERLSMILFEVASQLKRGPTMHVLGHMHDSDKNIQEEVRVCPMPQKRMLEHRWNSHAYALGVWH